MSQADTSTSDDIVSCPKCGTTVHKNGLGSHKGSKKCKVIQNQNEIKERDLVPIPNSSKIREFLKENGYPVERLGYKYNDDAYFNHKDTVQKRYYSTREGVNKSQKRYFPNATENGYKVSIEERTNGYWVCRVEPDDMPTLESELVVIDVTTSEDMSRRRVAYLRGSDRRAFTTDGEFIGLYKEPEDVIQSDWDVDSSSVVSKIV